ncbi:hypothetical protein TCAL_10163 [Tigriopus californicus]|uniref:Glycolipid transfer protein domain-containing protein n=1 Tax=Tigriopus californicus TaxID=6832 RepID=A0A553P7K9_TIGCA|nr:ceramide-1-phosphate transfer protein-like [Tigriopus californicus]TRY73678.1 hypothetical protein TCAL_10163 [Tigriopus californicus]|eukprot:TCALIF_10163-PA protein Name:"Similar to GLTPD1 Ceramide-1-phosphate transfer protein (Bos taurus)" AED:0.01 eAED:0.02 QI:0/-1/0/1/-1/1/1/0/244
MEASAADKTSVVSSEDGAQSVSVKPSPSQGSPVHSEFNLDLLHQYFADCLKPDGQVDIDLYALGFEEIVKFLNLLGTVFGWVASDVHHKLANIAQHRKGSAGAHYETINTMVDYEIKEKLIKPKAKETSSGTRNLLRLHRALEFISKFLHDLPEMDMSDKCCTHAQAAYKQTLIKYHPWVVQKAALMAMHMLPTKIDLIRNICEETDEAIAHATETLIKAVKAMDEVFNKTQEIYQAQNLLDLP